MLQVTSDKRKPLSYGTKLRKLYAGEFYLSTEAEHLAPELDSERDVIAYIDEYGTWTF